MAGRRGAVAVLRYPRSSLRNPRSSYIDTVPTPESRLARSIALMSATIPSIFSAGFALSDFMFQSE